MVEREKKKEENVKASLTVGFLGPSATSVVGACAGQRRAEDCLNQPKWCRRAERQGEGTGAEKGRGGESPYCTDSRSPSRLTA